MSGGLKYDEPTAGPLVAVELIGGNNVQLIKFGFGPDGQFFRVTDAMPLPVRLGAGVALYDSGPLIMTDTLAPVTADPTYVDVLLFINTSDEVVEVTVEDGDGNIYVPAAQLQPREVRPIPLHGIRMNGVSWLASVAGVVNAQIKGMQ